MDGLPDLARLQHQRRFQLAIWQMTMSTAVPYLAVPAQKAGSSFLFDASAMPVLVGRTSD